MYNFSYDATRVLLTVVQQGYWSMQMFRDYECDYLAHHESIRRQHRTYRVIADCRDYPVQSTEVSAAFALLFDRLMRENKGRCAIITPSALNKMQAKHAIPYENVRVFPDTAQAKDWLFSDDSPGD